MKTRTISRFPLGYDGKMLLLDQHLIMMLQEQNQHKSKAMTSQQRDWLAAKMVHDATAITMLYEHQHDKIRSTDATRARDHFGKHSLFAKWWFLFSECWVVNAGEIMTQQGTGVGCFPCFSGDRVTWIVGEHTLVSTSEAEKTGKKKRKKYAHGWTEEAVVTAPMRRTALSDMILHCSHCSLSQVSPTQSLCCEYSLHHQRCINPTYGKKAQKKCMETNDAKMQQRRAA